MAAGGVASVAASGKQQWQWRNGGAHENVMAT